MTMDRIQMKWNEFRKLHKGTPSKEISAKWKLYKAGEYDVTVVNEAPRAEEELKALKQINNKLSTRGLGLRTILY